MKIFLSSDMEGTAGVVDWEQCRPGQNDYELYRELLQNEVNAAIDGALGAGGAESTRSWSTTHTGGWRTSSRTGYTATHRICPAAISLFT